MNVRLYLLIFALCTGCMTGCNVFPVAPAGVPTRGEKETVPGLPGKHSVRVSQFVFLSDFEIPKNQPLFKDLGNLREQVVKELSLPPSAAQMIFVYVFQDRDHFEKFMQLKYPDLPRRRAFFVAQPRRGGQEDLLVYSYWGDRIQQDLRHELTHALLHSCLKDVPLWLDEGLAEYFEVPAGWKGVNYQHVEQLIHAPEGPIKLNLERLEGLTDVRQMSPGEYREAWAWVHWMLRGNAQARKELIGYLHDLRSTAKPGPLLPRIVRVSPSLDAAVIRHLQEIDRTRTSKK